jgi:hypothetical protein
MTDPDIPAEARAWLFDHIQTYEHLEIMLLAHKQRDRDWTADSVGVALKLPAASAAEVLADLTASGLLERRETTSPVFRYRPASPGHERAVDCLVRSYEEDRLNVIKLMTANALHRVRTGAMRAFADAFVVGRKRRDG